MTGIVLAGGKSRRMGQDKAQLRLCGRTLLELQSEKLRLLGTDEILISGAPQLPGTRAVPDRFPGCGPLAGLEACLREAGSETCVILCVDVPLVPVSLLRELIRVQRRTGCDAAIAEHGGLWEPLIGVYRSALAGRAESLLREDRRSVRALLECADTRLVSFPGDARLLLNCNAPEDYARLLELCKPERGAEIVNTAPKISDP